MAPTHTALTPTTAAVTALHRAMRDLHAERAFDRGAATLLAPLIRELLEQTGLPRVEVRTHTRCPGYFRAETRWDLVALCDGQLVAAIGCGSQRGAPEDETHHRIEACVADAMDLQAACRAGRFGHGVRPFVGYFLLLEDGPATQERAHIAASGFEIDPIFRGASYCRRYEILLERLVREGLYTATCLALTDAATGAVTHPGDDVSFRRFAATLEGHALAFLRSRGR